MVACMNQKSDISYVSMSLSILTAIFPGGPGLAGSTRNVSILDFIGAFIISKHMMLKGLTFLLI